jgi:hypothetical protein
MSWPCNNAPANIKGKKTPMSDLPDPFSTQETTTGQPLEKSKRLIPSIEVVAE